MLPHVDADLRVRRVRDIASLTQATLDDCWPDLTAADVIVAGETETPAMSAAMILSEEYNMRIICMKFVDSRPRPFPFPISEYTRDVVRPVLAINAAERSPAAVHYNCMMTITSEDRQALSRAVQTLETQGFVVRLSNWVGVPVDQILKRLPASTMDTVNRTVAGVLERCWHAGLYKFESDWPWARSRAAMKAAVAATGAVGGAFGVGALMIELPMTTSVMLRSIAEIGRAEGEDVRSDAGRIACLEVLAFGDGGSAEDTSTTGYFAVRAALATEVTEALKHLASRTMSGDTAPVLIRLIATVASRFGIVVSEKAAATAIPIIGAVGSAALNAMFMDHFQDMAHGHFTVRRLERKYGASVVRTEYDRLLEGLHQR